MQKNCGKFIAAIILVGLFILSLPNYSNAGLKQGDRAPAFELTDMDDKTVSLNAIMDAGKPVILSFFSTWCHICKKEIKDLHIMSAQYDARVYLISVDKNKNKLRRFIKKHKIILPVLRDPNGKIMAKKYDLRRGAFLIIPKAFLIAPNGVIEHITESYDEKRKNQLKSKLAEIKNKKWRRLNEVAVFFTGSANGYLDSSHSYKRSYGGFIKLISFLKQEKKKHPKHLLFDSGDFLPPNVSKSRAEFTLKAMALADYDAIAVGDQDIYFKGFMAAVKEKKLPFITSNLSLEDGIFKPICLPDKVITIGNMKIRILSFMPSDVFSFYPKEFTDKIKIKDLREIMKGGKKADFLILLSHSGVDYDKKIAKEFREIDLIIGGHSQTLLKNPMKIGNSLIVQAGSKLRQVGKIILRFNDDKKLANYDYEIIPLINKIPDNPQMKALIKEYKKAQITNSNPALE